MSRKSTPANIFKWKAEYIGYFALEFLLSRLKLDTVYEIGAFIGRVFFRCSPKYRGIVKRNLIMTMDKNGLADPTPDDVEEVFHKNGGNLFTILAAGQKDHQSVTSHLNLDLEDKRVLDSALDSTGVIIMLAHMGNWEILSKLTDYLKEKRAMGALYRPLNNPNMDALMLKRREMEGFQLISYKNPAFSIIKLLKQRGLFCMLSDQKITMKGQMSSFFGRPTPFTRLPMIMHEKTGAPIFTLSNVSIGSGQWKINTRRIEKPTQQKAMDALAESMSHSLSDCFWFQDRWQAFPIKSIREAEDTIESEVYGKKPLPGIIESREVLKKFPKIKKTLNAEHYPLSFWDEGADPENAYFAVGSSKKFIKSCHRVGLKKACITPQRALRLINK